MGLPVSSWSGNPQGLPLLLSRNREASRMDCPECSRLSADRERLKKVYETAVDLLFATGYRAEDCEYRRMKSSAAEARMNLETTQLKLESHQRRHARD
jgi:C4-type Zn-finger protein